ncbi:MULTISPECIES: hypothetical protein [Chryseobacterium]|uniref:DUF4329 domain-containing protein n=1 Tax=Chryseobacterium camelliae TaxID=1265445 RepID=A0ABU0TLJ8_9FLAO|nr:MULTISPECIES: hypothetical protein [Chryseobacterium]MDT3408278.1 hypothetical protein [Pseudacidovorax intermedius]MDQ1097866.1 hypothetical protein [Chryseobacterium camelliae]MDQ1101801.1 hypothetical protein [Chryseobacterium sp. SORGH_AS_1048]MDR6085239.1 hypothetical protein [Chryseobacterium sp. SORGH_AS_0909]MDR6129597.1 hypothetical protein [Chryseobacterium sp. SORGH_AS_1175]
MMRKLISWLSFMMAFSLVLLSCVHDEIYTASDPASKEYHSKSVFREDEKYIKNVMQIYFEHEAEIKKGNAVPLWDYAMTMGNYDESFLIVPLAEGGKVTACLQVPRNGDHVTFLEDRDSEHIKFFQRYIASKKRKAVKSEPYSSAESKGITECQISAVSMWYPADEYGSNAGHWETNYIVTCPPEPTDGDGNGGGEQPTYPYPGGGGSTSPQNPKNPCDKLKNQSQNQAFKNKVAALDKPEVLNYDHEMGYAAGYPPANTGVTGTQYPPMENTLGSHSVSLPDGNQYFGFMHTHNNESNGGIPVKIFSPADLATFLTSCVANADAHGSIGDAFAMVVTSEGNYMLQYTGSSSGFGIGSNTIKFWKLWYEREIKAIQDEDGTINQNKVENLFLRFLKEKVKIDGIELYQIAKTTGQAQKLNLNNDNTVVSIPCP